MLKVSIITVSFNSAETISNTMASVQSQDWPLIEHIIIDGNSTDETNEIIRKEKISNTIFISEPDDGIYDAMNKGIALATGDIIGFLNSDDFFADRTVVREIANSFNNYSDMCYGDLVYVSKYNIENSVRYWKSGSFSKSLFKIGWIPAHPTFYVRSSYFSRYGNFETKYKLAADFELMHRFISSSEGRISYIPKILVCMRLGGVTNSSLKNIFLQNCEIIKVINIGFNVFKIAAFAVYKIYKKLLEYVGVKIIDER